MNTAQRVVAAASIMLAAVTATSTRAVADSSSGQGTTATVVRPGTLAVTVAQPTVAFGSVIAGSPATSDAGVLQFATPNVTSWSVTVVATAMTTSADDVLPFTALSVTPGTVNGGKGKVTVGPPDSFTGSGGVSAPLTLATVTGNKSDTWQQRGTTFTLSVPAAQASGDYAGSVQYTITGG